MRPFLFYYDHIRVQVRLRDVYYPIFHQGGTEVPKNLIDVVVNALEILEAFLANDPFLVGQQLTIADICLGLSVPLHGVYVPLTTDKFPKIIDWLNRINKEIPWFEEMNGKYTEQHRQMFYDTIEKNKQKK